MPPLLDVQGLTVAFGRGTDARPVLADVTFTVRPGETLGIVGESGSGKSVTALALMGLLPRGVARVTGGRAAFAGSDLLALGEDALRAIRGRRIGMIFQEPMTSLNPVLTIERQVTEALIHHRRIPPARARSLAADALGRAGIDRPAQRLAQYPHELSGGMRQRVMIAASMVLEPELLIADEPTTALDVTIQAQILELMRKLTRDAGTALVLITHDMGVVAEMAERVVVMHRGRIIEGGAVEPIFAAPRAAYTRRLLVAVPRGDVPARATPAPVAGGAVLRLEGAVKRFGRQGLSGAARQSGVLALDGVDLALYAGETLALVGESGSGKSTLGRAAARLLDLDQGRLLLAGRDVTRARGKALRLLRRHVQVVFQDPYASLDPRWHVARTVAEPLVAQGLASGRAARERAADLLERVRLPAGSGDRYPHELSGGQRQRVAIARALAAGPTVIVADEPTSALDVSTQAEVLCLLDELQRERGLAFLLITHDLAVVRSLAHRVAVMRAGRILEEGPAAAVLGDARHPYTRALLAAAPLPDPRARDRVRPDPPPAEPARSPPPRLIEVAPGHRVAA